MPEKFNFDEVIDRTGSASYQWDCRQEFYGDNGVFPMWVADMHFKSPQVVLDALRQRIDYGNLAYTAMMPSFYKAITNWMQTQFNWQIMEDWVSFSPGIVTALCVAIRAYTQPGDGVLIQTPVYSPFFKTVERNNRQVIVNQLLLKEGYYTMDFGKLEQQLPKVKLAILCSPHNPVGRVWTTGELHRFGMLCKKHGVIVLSDEIHADLVYDPYQQISFANAGNNFADFSATMIAPSKTFNIAGLYTSAIIIPCPELKKRFDTEMDKSYLVEGNLFGIFALEAAYTKGKRWIEALLEYLRENRDIMLNTINNLPGMRAIVPEGTFIMWVDCREMGLSDDELMKFFIEKARIGPAPGTIFGKGGSGFVRLNFAYPRAMLAEVLQQLKNAVDELIPVR
ncbi:MAG: pyridoxal phosphate-dependent aminotransferase [Candidatus Cloacimonetes bacterium]|nr:pyridoxal phosphate-dependent aminotransferase [Candidatus Cloacimonadota bacterium]